MKKDKVTAVKLQEKSRIPIAPLAIFLLVKMLGYGAEIVNDEIISKEKNGNGIEVSLTDTIINNGAIRGQTYLAGGADKTDLNVSISSTANGVRGNVKTNDGLIEGIAEVTGGNTLDTTATASSIRSANGVYGEVKTNNGVISGHQILKGGTPDSNVYSGVDSRVSSNGVNGEVNENNGLILGYGEFYGNKSNVEVVESSNGVSGSLIKNNGVSSGGAILSGVADNPNMSNTQKADVVSTNSGNGLMVIKDGRIENDGVLSGYVSSTSGNTNGMKDFEKIEYSGNGITKSTNLESKIINKGVIKGSQSAIAAPSIAGAIYNYGILAGREIFGDGVEIIENDMHSKGEKKLVAIDPKIEYNQGIYIKLKSETSSGKETGKVELGADGSPVIEEITIGAAGYIDGKEIVNGDVNGNIATAQTIVGNVDTYLNSTNLVSGENVIINGSGMQKGALVIDRDTELKNSVVNGYNTAVYVEGVNKFKAENTVFNGGGLENDVAVIKGDAGDNTISILGNSIVNGSIDLVDGTNSLTIGNNVKINGDIHGGKGNDTLSLGDSTSEGKDSNLNIFGIIDSFETINTSGKVTLFETAQVSGATDINIQDGDLLFRVDPNIKVDEKVTGHALYGNKGTVSSNGGNLVVGLNGIGEGTTIAMGDTTIDKASADNVKVNSLVLDAKVSEDGKEINVKVLDSIPDPDPKPDPNPEPSIKVDSVLYNKLDQGYKSIVSAGEIGKLANTTLLDDKTYNESLGGLLIALDQLYANNPYSYTMKSTRDNLKLFEENMSYLTIKPEKNEWIVQGKGIYTGVKNDNKASGKNNYGFDTGHRNYKTTTDTGGGLATFEYGISDKTSIGGIIGGSNQNVNFRGSNEIKANSLYLGTFAKTEVDNFRFTGGLGYQYTDADTDRKISNGYDTFKTNDKYNINSFNAFLEAKYVYEGTQNWSIEPKTRLSYYYVDQDKIDEGYDPEQLSIGVDEAKSKTVDLEVGVDIVKSVYMPKAKLSNVFYAGVVNTLGDTSKDLKGHVIGKDKNGSKFDIEGTELPKTSGKVAYNLELEQDSGMIYTAGVSLKFSEDYNRAVNTFIGVGYKY